MLCRHSCCGSTAKHPDTDHNAQRRSLEFMTEPGLRVRVVDCLDECARSDVVLVRRHGRHRSGRDVWLEQVLTATDNSELPAWLRDGAQTITRLSTGPSSSTSYIRLPRRSARSS
jgi:hypothetical protein